MPSQTLPKPTKFEPLIPEDAVSCEGWNRGWYRYQVGLARPLRRVGVRRKKHA